MSLPISVSYIEMVWTTIVLFGFLFSLFGVVDAYRDEVALLATRRNGHLTKQARGNRRDAGLLALVLGEFLAAGVLSMLLPPSPGVRGRGASTVNVIIIGALIGGALALSVMVMLQRYDRKLLMAGEAYDPVKHGERRKNDSTGST